MYRKKPLSETLPNTFAVKIPALLFLFFTNSLSAQLPNTDIWLYDINYKFDSIFLSNGKNITNRIGYDNQPVFSADGKELLFTSIKEDNQADIYKYTIDSKQTVQITTTTTSEYSPQIMPDGKNISAVMVEKDSTQRLWKFPIGGGAPSLVLEKTDSIAYYSWYLKNELLFSTIDVPSRLNFVSVKKQTPDKVDVNVGRCLKLHNNVFYYPKKYSDNSFRIYGFNVEDWKVKEIGMVIENEDFDFLDDDIIYGKENELFKLNSFDKKVVKIANLSVDGLEAISRIAVSADGTKLAIVAEKK